MKQGAAEHNSSAALHFSIEIVSPRYRVLVAILLA
jgi:hypothetical protein